MKTGRINPDLKVIRGDIGKQRIEYICQKWIIKPIKSELMHKDLDIWKIGIDLVEMVYQLTKKYPKEEIYSLTAQIRRASVSVPSNIAEGAARKNKSEFLQFLYIALGSLSELETQLIISQRLNYLQSTDIFETVEKLRRKLLNYIKYIKSF